MRWAIKMDLNPLLVEFIREHNLKPINKYHNGKITKRWVALKMCTSDDAIKSGVWFSGKMIDDELRKYDLYSRDSIQSINKTEQWGLANPETRINGGVTEYRFVYPFKFVGVHIKKRKIGSSISLLNRDEEIDIIKENIKKYYLDVPNDTWQLGHKNPDIEDSGPSNLVWQPPIQGKYRDRFIFDYLGLMKYPTPKEISKNPLKYYSEEQLRELHEFLCNRFNASS